MSLTSISIFRVLIFPLFLVSINNSNIVNCEQGNTKGNKFREREATDDTSGYPQLDEDDLLNTQCPQNLELRWQTEVSSSIYATPLIADINSDGKLDVVVPSFVHYLEVLEGSDGDKMPGWPAYHQSNVHSSPLLYDIDKDGIREIALATYNGEVLFFRPSGYMMSDKLVVPRRRVRKDWNKGLKKDPVDRSHPDVHDDELVEEANESDLLSHLNTNKMGSNIPATSSNEGHSVTADSSTHDGEKRNDNHSEASPETPKNTNANNTGSDTTVNASTSVNNSESEFEKTMKLQNVVSKSTNSGVEGTVNADASSSTHDGEKRNDNHSEATSETLKNTNANNTGSDPTVNASASVNNSESESEKTMKLKSTNSGLEGTVNADATMNKSSPSTGETNHGRRLLEDSASKEVNGGSNNDQSMNVENENPLEADADASFELFRDSDELADEYNYDYDDYVDENMWGDEDWVENPHESAEDYIDIDSHILNTPVIADIDDDGVSEMVVAVSYFFDRDYYEKPEHAKELGGIDIDNYVASSIVIFNLDTKQVKWTADLDMSTDSAKYRAYMYSSPTVADLDNDRKLDILIGTSYGLFYVLDHHGKVRDKFPLEMAELQGAVVAADINDDGKIEIVTADVHGNVAAWTPQGKEIWETHIKSLVPQGPTVGDVDGDGHTDVVIPTLSGNIHVLSGRDGKPIHPYPYRTHGRVMNQVLLVDLSRRGQKRKGLTIVTTSFDGYLYLIDGPTSCADVVDIGEISYSMVLADNVDGGDDLDLIVTTMNGNVFCFSTPSPHHPLKAWRSINQGRNNVANRYNREGIYVLPSHRNFRDEEGKNFWIEFEIVDGYRHPSGTQAPYNVTMTLLVPGNYQGERSIKQTQIYDRPGKYRMMLPTVGVRTTGTVLVEMLDINGLYFSDEFSLTFHMYYYKLLKWLVFLPMLGMFGILVRLGPQEAVPLPSFSRNTDL